MFSRFLFSSSIDFKSFMLTHLQAVSKRHFYGYVRAHMVAMETQALPDVLVTVRESPVVLVLQMSCMVSSCN